MPAAAVSAQQARPLEGKTAVVTGANSGIGFETAVELAVRGASVVLACRRVDAAEEAAAKIRAAAPGAAITVLPLDLSSQESVRDFVTSFTALRRPLHILVNNAGANFWGMPPSYTAGGVGLRAQANFLGAYTLTRLLEGCLLSSAPSRVVNVSSVTHRAGTLRCGATRFLREWECGSYADAKLALVLHAYELDRRCAARGLRACAVDPGAVQTGIWAHTPLARRGVRAVMDQLYAPPKEGAATVVHAACCDLEAAEARAAAAAPAPGVAGDSGPAPRSTHREPGRLFFARGLFAAAPVTADGWLPSALWKGAALLASVVDQPLRRLSCGTVASSVAAVRSSPESYDRLRARELWNAAADAAGLPQEV